MDVSKLPYSVIEELLNLGLLVCGVTPYQNMTMKHVVPSLLDGSEEHNLLIEKAITPALRMTGSTANATLTLMELAAFLETTPAHVNKAPSTIRFYGVMSLITLPVILLRLYVRRFVTGKIRKEDWAIVAASCASVFYAIIMSLNESLGFSGRHIWDLSWHMVKSNLLWLFFSEIFFAPTLAFIKTSIIIFYWGLIPHKPFHRIPTICFFVVMLVTVFGMCIVAFQCDPIPYWRDPLAAKCINRKRVWTAWGICHIITDWALLIIPMPVIWHLKMKMREKIIVMGMFAIGAFVCIASVNRVVATNSFVNGPDHTYKESLPGIWGIIEIDLAIMISCVLALKALVVRCAPSLLGQKSHSQIVDLQQVSPMGDSGDKQGKGSKKHPLDVSLSTKDTKDTNFSSVLGTISIDRVTSDDSEHDRPRFHSKS